MTELNRIFVAQSERPAPCFLNLEPGTWKSIPMTNPDDVFAHIQQLAEQHADIVAVWLYGSRAAR